MLSPKKASVMNPHAALVTYLRSCELPSIDVTLTV